MNPDRSQPELADETTQRNWAKPLAFLAVAIAVTLTAFLLARAMLPR